MVVDPTYPKIGMTQFKEVDWKPFYGNVQEAIPKNGKDVDLRLYVEPAMLETN
jgi:hypothetical protein